MTIARYGHTATLLSNGMVLIAGGKWDWSGVELARADLYDPDAGTFATTGRTIEARSEHTATLLPSGKVLIAGGYGDSVVYLSSAELFDPSTGQFVATGSMTERRDIATATLLLNGKVLIAGGISSTSVTDHTPLASAELYQ